MDEAKEPFIIPIVSIGIMNTDLNGAFGMNGAATVSPNIGSVEARLSSHMIRGPAPEIHLIRITIEPGGEEVMKSLVIHIDFCKNVWSLTNSQ
jgi:hypothetical protein